MLRTLLKIFPPTFSKTITLYNKHYDPDLHKTTWHRTVLDGCFYSRELSQKQEGASVFYTNTYNARIPKNEQYKPPAEWREAPGKGFTLQTEDLIFLGSVNFEIDEDTHGQRAADLLNKCSPDCFIVKAAKDNTNAAGVLEHYRAMG